jgi:hypothetical protein
MGSESNWQMEKKWIFGGPAVALYSKARAHDQGNESKSLSMSILLPQLSSWVRLCTEHPQSLAGSYDVRDRCQHSSGASWTDKATNESLVNTDSGFAVSIKKATRPKAAIE